MYEMMDVSQGSKSYFPSLAAVLGTVVVITYNPIQITSSITLHS